MLPLYHRVYVIEFLVSLSKKKKKVHGRGSIRRFNDPSRRGVSVSPWVQRRYDEVTGDPQQGHT